MRHNLPLLLLTVLAVLGLGACDAKIRRGSAGDSCTSTNDCGSGSSCIGEVCVAAESSMSAQSEGATCDARRNCAMGLSCVSGICQIASSGTSNGGNRYSGKGESCAAKNDCEPSLACVMGACRSLTVALPRVPKSCYRVECATKDDCCQAFVPNPNCATYEMNCTMDPIFCNTYRSLCLCTQDCIDEQCVASAPGCQTNTECTSTQTPYCVDAKCVQCDKDAACAGAGAKCSQGVCMAACTQDENCPLLHACQDGVCVETGCKSDRECAFMTKNQLAVCNAGECEVPCSTDNDCTSMSTTPNQQQQMTMNSVAGATRGFEACDMGKCTFVGCESDAECRSLLGLESQRGRVKAVCR